MKKQVGKEHYHFSTYVDRGRWNSYYSQIEEITSANAGNVLEIGIGSGIIGDVLRKIGTEYKTMDIDSDLEPDFIGSVLEIPFDEKSFDIVCAYQVLEHLPFKDFELALSEMMRVATKRIIISLPDVGKVVRLCIWLPRFGTKQIMIPIIMPKKEHTFDGEHYWVINRRNYSHRRIRDIIVFAAHKSMFALTKNYRLSENPSHRFFVLERKDTPLE